MKREKIGGQWDDDVVRGHERGSIDRTQIGPDVDQDHVRVVLVGGPFHDPMKGRGDPEGIRGIGDVIIKTLAPSLCQPILEQAEPQITGHEPDPFVNFNKLGVPDIAKPIKQGLDETEDRSR